MRIDPRALLILIAAAMPVSAQNIFGTILGSVRDPSGAAAPRVRVTATATDTGQSYEGATNDSGYYEFSYLKPGRYSVRVAASGFQTAERPRVDLRVEDRIRLDFDLKVGEVTTSVSITGEAPPVQSESASLGQVITERTVREMPVMGRNVFELAGLAAGVQVNPTAEKRVLAKGGFDNADIAMNGGRIRTNEYLLDGVTVLLPENNNPAVAPTPEGTQEFKVQTGNSGAQFGRTGGGTINVVTKGGTNEFHGTAFEFFRNARLTANDFFANARRQERGSSDFHTFGGTIGGPIKRNRTFFFAEYQQYRERISGAGGVLTFPTMEQRAGDFSATRVADGSPVTIYDPFTTRPAASGTGFTRTPFPGNRIPAPRIDRVASRSVQHLPQPNRDGEGPARLFNFAYSTNDSVTSDQGSIRVDHRFSDRHGIFSRFTRTVTRIFSAPVLGTIADTGADPQVQSFLNGVINGTFVFSPTRMVNYRYGATRKLQDATPYYFGQIKLTDLGFPSYVSAATQQEVFPQMSFTGYSGVGTAPGTLRGNDIHTWVADFTEIRGRHTLKFGADTRLYNQTPFRTTASSGIYTFTNSFTQGPDPLRAARGSGDGFASFLTGYGTGNIQYSPAFAIRNGFMGLYVHDDIRLGRLTINAGLRWEWEQPRTERYNRFGNFDFNREFPGNPGVRGVLAQAGREHYPRGQFDTALINFAPQIGLAYRIGPSMALRAGYGIVYSPRIGYTSTRNYGASGAEIQTQWVSSVDGVTPLQPLSDPYPTGIFVQSGSEADRRLMGQALTITDRNSRNNTYMQQWNVSLQRAFLRDWTVEAAYSASRGIRLPIAVQFN
ncbi:MAG: carboxypeptidase regulatory-like domain-containing protein [Acidobacteria bacterium]|nr:carboxypeptidase regulatory-like domain-containing protein [Acidobacteriota bacterium]